jgi:type IV fimbrial biogenesis protein FimT
MPTQALTRRDPRNTGKGFSTHHGFTVIELMITIAVLAVITSLALPSYRTILEKRQVTSGAEQLGAFLSSAQLESVKRNQFVAVNYQENSGAWCLGMRAGDTAGVDCDCTVTVATAANACALDGALKVFNSSILNYPDVLQSADFSGSDDTLVFDPVRGLTQDAENVKLELLSDAGSYALDVDVSVTGRVKICSNKNANKDVPGYKECSA